MHKKVTISLMNPRAPYTFLTVTIGFIGIGISYYQFKDLNFHYALSNKILVNVVLPLLATVLFCYRLIVLYLLSNRDWQTWATSHDGHYSHPANLQVQPYGMVLDMLQGINDQQGEAFVIMRAIQTYYVGKSLKSRRFVILARPNDEFNDRAIDSTHLTILAAKQYYYRLPTISEMEDYNHNFLN